MFISFCDYRTWIDCIKIQRSLFRPITNIGFIRIFPSFICRVILDANSIMVKSIIISIFITHKSVTGIIKGIHLKVRLCDIRRINNVCSRSHLAANGMEADWGLFLSGINACELGVRAS